MALLLMFNSELDVAVLNITMPSTATSSSLTVWNPILNPP